MYESFQELSENHIAGKDYDITKILVADSEVAIIAPHGGKTESGTSEIAYLVAKDKFNYYSLDGKIDGNSFKYLHLTSHKFDEPQCLELISRCTTVISIHGCKGHGSEIFLGGLDTALRDKLANELLGSGYHVYATGHKFPGVRKSNIVNRGLTGKGVQIELTTGFRVNADHDRFGAVLRKAISDYLDIM